MLNQARKSGVESNDIAPLSHAGSNFIPTAPTKSIIPNGAKSQMPNGDDENGSKQANSRTTPSLQICAL